MNDDHASKPRDGRHAARWAAVAVLAAFLPVLAQTWPFDRFSTVLWLVSMPLCVLGFAMLAKELAARWSSRANQD
ncbi:hypothetical protein [Actinomyces sp. ZJ308]|uniref:hypothetical protein n=1 Tax=Actinomyces sp. ZJ308 TaxID=2708342 RepID=UPI00141F7D44|nr:hypothetical protein [Actinomyces sp. ZJ308]